MANICSFMMKIKGSRESLEKFICLGSSLQGTRSNQFLYSTDFIDFGYCSDDSLIINGQCSWSVYSSMLYGKPEIDFDLNSEIIGAVNLQSVCRELKLQIQVASEEPGIGFKELFVISVDGKIIEEDSYFIQNHLQ